jgi:hypothetical protein
MAELRFAAVPTPLAQIRHQDSICTSLYDIGRKESEMGCIHTMNRCLIDAVPGCGGIVRRRARTTWDFARPSTCLRCLRCPGKLDGDSQDEVMVGALGSPIPSLSLSATAHDDDVLRVLNAAARLGGRWDWAAYIGLGVHPRTPKLRKAR